MVKGQSAGLEKISLDTFAERLPNLLQWMTSESKCSLLIFKLHGQRSRSNRWSLWKLPNLVQWMPLAKRSFCGFLVTLSKVKVKLLVLEKMMIFILSVVNFINLWSFAWWLPNLLFWLTLKSRLSILLFGSRGQTTGLSLSIFYSMILWSVCLIIINCIYATLLNFVTGALCFSNISWIIEHTFTFMLHGYRNFSKWDRELNI